MKEALLINLIGLILEKGVPAFIKWQDGVELANPTLEDLEALKVKKMSEKNKEG